MPVRYPRGENSELPDGHPKNKFKGRVVFQGNRVLNQNWEAAMFQDLGSNPATMEASRAADFYGSCPDNETQIADAEQACIQARLTGTPCWICCLLRNDLNLGRDSAHPCSVLSRPSMATLTAEPFGNSTAIVTLRVLVSSLWVLSGLRAIFIPRFVSSS